MKDIEKNQTKPTVAMIQALFQEASPKQKTLILEKEIPKKKEEVKFKEKLKTDNEL
ncbi:MAG: hypothetical protein GY760_03465 [Deltaproteobacteria bacterium]|nr:hypothetical protein [Deltaproteobacteria bacterium]